MSGILNRMIARARSPLPRVQPLYTPLFAEAEVGLRTPLSEPSDLEETGQPAAYRDPAAGQEATSEQERPKAATISPELASSDRSKALPAIGRTDSGEPPSRPSATGQLNVIGDDIVSEVPHEPISARSVEMRRESLASPTRNEGTDWRHQSAMDKTLEESAKTGRPAKEQTLVPPQRERGSRRFPGAASDPRASERASQEPPVTISIGHIEIRAAQAAERPRKVTFRPKVSLADFLSRKHGGARE